METPKLAYVEWLDINTNAGPWVDEPENTLPSKCQSFGWLVVDAESHIAISAAYSDQDATDGGHREVLQCHSIPRGCITKLEVFLLETLLAQRA